MCTHLLTDEENAKYSDRQHPRSVAIQITISSIIYLVHTKTVVIKRASKVNILLISKTYISNQKKKIYFPYPSLTSEF